MTAAKIVDHMGFDITARGPKIGLAPIAASTGRGQRQIVHGAPQCCRCYKRVGDEDTVLMERKQGIYSCPKCKHKQCILCKPGEVVRGKWWNNLTHDWQDTPPPMGWRIASTPDGTPLTFAEKAQPRQEFVAPAPLTPADVARMHGQATLRRIRGA